MKELFETSKGQLWYEFTSKGSDKHLLLIHGFMEDHEIWKTLVYELDINIIQVDLLGFGRSVPNASFDFSMQQHALVINELLNFLEPTHLSVLGHSMGGYISLELLLLRPTLNIGLLHSTITADSEERKLNRNKTIDVLEREPGIFIREFYWNLFAEHRKNEFVTQIDTMRQKAEKIPVPYIMATVKALRDRRDHTVTWNTHENNNIWIGGAGDKLLNFSELELLAEEGPAAFFELEDSGHMGFYEEPELLVEILKNWLDIE